MCGLPLSHLLGSDERGWHRFAPSEPFWCRSLQFRVCSTSQLQFVSRRWKQRGKLVSGVTAGSWCVGAVLQLVGLLRHLLLLCVQHGVFGSGSLYSRSYRAQSSTELNKRQFSRCTHVSFGEGNTVLVQESLVKILGEQVSQLLSTREQEERQVGSESHVLATATSVG